MGGVFPFCCAYTRSFAVATLKAAVLGYCIQAITLRKAREFNSPALLL